MKYTLYLFCFIFLVSLIGCKPKKDVSANQVVMQSITTDSIVFAHFSIEKNENHSTQIHLSHLKKYAGTLKTKDETIRNEKLILKADFYANEKFLFDLKISHPLYPTIEMYEKDKMDTKTFSFSNATFVLRFQRNPSITKIIFSEIINNKTTTLDTINIQL